MTTEKRDNLIDKLRTELLKEFEVESGNNTEIYKIRHFWVKLLGGCALIAVESWLITLLYYRYPLSVGIDLNLTELFFVSTILAIGINIATAKVIYIIKKTNINRHHKIN